jgi:YaiO family outer membrane protein
MLTSLALALVIGCAVGQDTGPETRREAEQLGRAGRTRDALHLFQDIVARKPDDVDARIWVARLLQRLGYSHLAEAEFRRALAQAPNHVDALIGLAATLNSRRAYPEASELIDRAEQLAPRSADVLAARAYSLRRAGRSSEAEMYYALARTHSPEDADIEQEFDRTRRINRHRIEGAFQYEPATASLSSAHVEDVTVDIRASDRVRVNGRVQAQNRFSTTEARAGGGVEWRPRPDLALRASTLISPGADLIARTDALADVEHTRGRLELGGGGRHMSFAAARVWIFSPAATLWLSDRTGVTVRYYNSWTSFPLRAAVADHAGLARLRYSLNPRVWLDVGYSRGYESIDTLTSERVGSFRADTVSAGVLYHAGLQSVATGVEYQRRSDDRMTIRVSLGVVHRF